MAEILKYVVIGENDEPIIEFEFDTADEARAAGQGVGRYAVICRTYTYDDSDLVWTSTGDTVWPPPPGSEGEPEDVDETEYLSRGENGRQLRESIAEMETGGAT